MKVKKNTNISTAIFSLGILMLFIGGFLLLVVFGAISYRNVVDSENHNYRDRELLSYLSTTIANGDYSEIYTYESADADSTVLVIVNEDEEHALRIYIHANNMVADYGDYEGELWPEDAIVLGNNGKLTVNEITKGLLMLETDAGQVYVKVVNYTGKR